MILDEQQLIDFFQKFPSWTLGAGELVRKITFKDFIEAMAFVNKVAEVAEAQGHHPDIEINYNQVTLKASTHDAGGITEQDTRLAEAIEHIMQS